MHIWLKLRRWQLCIGASLGLLLLASIGRGFQLPLPSFLGGDLIASPLGLILPAAWWLLLAQVLSQGDPWLEQTALRPIRAFDAGLLSMLSGLIMGLSWLLASVLNQPLLLAIARNCLGFMGLGLLAARLFGWQTAALMPIALHLLSGFFGQRAGQILVWAWSLQPNPNLASWLQAAILWLVGIGWSIVQPARNPG
ncbi:hypothetical protein [Herpetosiphon llansteffanensis]|uniref:hypothetical protein n=1 Tax=Herpetosiphon llansteffanensis TaxID=2094568 RepID=UPI000D7B9386|nr:hypothetical protein [Herpetosiphon llansteffanensis]